MEGIDGGQHHAVDGQSLSENESEKHMIMVNVSKSGTKTLRPCTWSHCKSTGMMKCNFSLSKAKITNNFELLQTLR